MNLQRLQRFFRRLLGFLFGRAPRARAAVASGSGGGGTVDPFASVRVPIKGRPSGRSSAVAVMEPEDAQVTTAVGTRPPRR